MSRISPNNFDSSADIQTLRCNLLAVGSREQLQEGDEVLWEFEQLGDEFNLAKEGLRTRMMVLLATANMEYEAREEKRGAEKI